MKTFLPIIILLICCSSQAMVEKGYPRNISADASGFTFGLSCGPAKGVYSRVMKQIEESYLLLTKISCDVERLLGLNCSNQPSTGKCSSNPNITYVVPIEHENYSAIVASITSAFSSQVKASIGIKLGDHGLDREQYEVTSVGIFEDDQDD